MNMLDGTLRSRDGQPVFALPTGLELSLAGYPFASPAGEGRPATLGIRPEQIAFQTRNSQTSRLPLALSLVEPMGADGLAWGEIADRQVSARIEADQIVPLGGTVDTFFAPSQVSLFDEEGARL